jgi:hypothetical protein
MKHGRETSRRSALRSTGSRLAERVGFEPTDHLTMVNALAGRPIRPLWHLSGAGAVYANRPSKGTGGPRRPPHYPVRRNGGRVDNCSRLESGRPQGPGVRIPPVPPTRPSRAPVSGRCPERHGGRLGHPGARPAGEPLPVARSGVAYAVTLPCTVMSMSLNIPPAGGARAKSFAVRPSSCA